MIFLRRSPFVYTTLLFVLLCLHHSPSCSADEAILKGRMITRTTTPSGYQQLKTMRKSTNRNFRMHQTPGKIWQQHPQQETSLFPTPASKSDSESNNHQQQPKNDRIKGVYYIPPQGLLTKQQERQQQRRLKEVDISGPGQEGVPAGQPDAAATSAATSAAAAGRGASQVANSSAETMSDELRTPRNDVPLVDWSWGTIWKSDGRDSFQDMMDKTNSDNADGGNSGVEDEKTPDPVDEGPFSEFSGASWMSQFVQALTPNPSPPSTLSPTPALVSSNLTQEETLQPTPLPTVKYDGATRGPCQLCSDGSEATMMTRTLIKSTISCQDIANALVMADANNCPMQKENMPVDIEAYCGCPGKVNTGSCPFCPAGKDNIWHNISIPALDDWTCEMVETYTGYLTNPAACTEMTVLSDLCCGTWEGECF